MLSGALMIMIIGYIYFNFREFFGIYYSWLLALLQLVMHSIGHILTFFPMLWLGYAGMPRRIQDYPWGYVGWNSVASLGHSIVLFSIGLYMCTVTSALFMKRSTDSRNKGFPFLSLRVSFLILDMYYARMSLVKKNFLGLKPVYKYTCYRSNYFYF
jgi:heme/copper-type cytochrome/quinol oxidase subunit 1